LSGKTGILQPLPSPEGRGFFVADEDIGAAKTALRDQRTGRKNVPPAAPGSAGRLRMNWDITHFSPARTGRPACTVRTSAFSSVSTLTNISPLSGAPTWLTFSRGKSVSPPSYPPFR